MKRIKLKYVGQNLNYSILKNVILDENLTDNDTIILDSNNLDDIALEYQEFYGERMFFPHLLLGVLIREANTNENVPNGRIGILKNDDESTRSVSNEEYIPYDGEVLYRCGWCGNVIDEDGYVLEEYNRIRAIYIIENKNDLVIVRKAQGKCCPNPH